MNALDARVVDAEILDGLRAEDPRALRSRRDLRRINGLMLQPRIMAGLLRRLVIAPPQRILELGAGDGHFMLSVARRMASAWPGVQLVLVDRVPLIDAEVVAGFKQLGWSARALTADVFDRTLAREAGAADLVTANLFLHHFDDVGLVALFRTVNSIAPRFVATEPLRSALALAASRMVWAIGANGVTRNDAAQSVRAGFRGSELSDLWREAGGAPVAEGRKGLFTQAFVGARGDT